MKLIIYYLGMAALFIAGAALVGSLTSCRTVKYVEREKLVYDSTAIKNLEAEKKVSRQLREENERLKSDSLGVRVEFFPDQTYRPTPYPRGWGWGRVTDTAILNRLIRADTTWYDSLPKGVKQRDNNFNSQSNMILPWVIDQGSNKKFILRSDGSIEVNGNIKSVNLTQKAQDVTKKKIESNTDSLAIEKKTEAVNISVTQESSTKSVKRNWGQTLWPLAIAFILGCIITYYRHRIPVLGPILKFFNGRFFNRLPPRP